MHTNYAIDACHWRCPARHEAGHAVASIVMSREVGRSWPAFGRVFIRPGATGPYVDRSGREIDCVGLVEGPDFWTPGLSSAASLRNNRTDFKAEVQVSMTLEIVYSLAGPFAQARPLGRGSKASARWDALLSGGCNQDYKRAEAVIADMRAMTESQTCDLVKRYWLAIDALAERLLQRHSLDYDAAAAIVVPLMAAARPSTPGRLTA
jgi:hypothetical protein